MSWMWINRSRKISPSIGNSLCHGVILFVVQFLNLFLESWNLLRSLFFNIILYGLLNKALSFMMLNIIRLLLFQIIIWQAHQLLHELNTVCWAYPSIFNSCDFQPSWLEILLINFHFLFRVQFDVPLLKDLLVGQLGLFFCKETATILIFGRVVFKNVPNFLLRVKVLMLRKRIAAYFNGWIYSIIENSGLFFLAFFIVLLANDRLGPCILLSYDFELWLFFFRRFNGG